MNEKDKSLMKIYGITCATEITYFYKNHRYTKLEDALNYAKIDFKNNEIKSDQRKDNYTQIQK